MQVVRDGDIPSYLGVGKMSLHQSSFQEVLALAQLSGRTPESAVLVGVQPRLLKDFGRSLTDVVRAKLPEALAVGLEVLAGWGVPGTRRQPGAAEPLFDASLAIDRYEAGRPSEDEACRIGDERVLGRRAALEPTILFQLNYKQDADFDLLCKIIRENLGSKENSSSTKP